MIAKEDIRLRAVEWQLDLDVVEKDYVLGWLLAALAEHRETSRQWVFKGGTCLKKCFFETYRFSEDLDFSLLPGARYTADELLGVLREVAARASDLSGIEFQSNTVMIRERQNKQGAPTFEARIAYRGPVANPSLPKVRFDLTRDEPILDGVARRAVFHAYPDPLPGSTQIGTYTLDELFAEKLRALTERTRPRDLYDIVFILENRPEGLSLERARRLFQEKCAVKRLAAPGSDALERLVRGSAELRSEWENMLGHQLPQLPPIDSVLARIAGLFGWLDESGGGAARDLPASAGTRGEEVVAAAGLQYWGGGVRLEAVRFAGTNRLMVEFIYKGQLRTAEPYSLRRSSTGKLLLYAWEQGSDTIKGFDTSRITGLRATTQPFVPRYRVEFVPSGSMAAPPIARRANRLTAGRREGGPVYIYECPRCNRQFEHHTRDARLRAHKDGPGGSRCPGRRGRLVDTRRV